MNNKYQKEIKTKWENTNTYQEYNRKTKNYTKEKWNEINIGLNNIFKQFSILMKNNKQTDSIETQNLVKELKDYITKEFYLCTNEILFELGNMYVSDERFKNNIDQFAMGTAEYLKQAIEVYCLKEEI